MHKGVANIIAIVALVILLSATGIVFLTVSKGQKNTDVKESPDQNITDNPDTETRGKEPDLSVTISNSPTTAPKATITHKPTSTPSPTPKPKPTCAISVTADSGNTMALKLIYSLSTVNNTYMTAAQWDFTGDGTWDTDWSQQNGTLSHTFPSPGSYTVKLHLQTSDGQTTDTCSKSVSVPQGFTVTFTGKAYNDINCNNVLDSGETYVSGATVYLFKMPEYSLYQTLTTNSAGDFSYSEVLAAGESLSIKPSVLGSSTYGVYFSASTYILNSSMTSSSSSLAVIPNENRENCN